MAERFPRTEEELIRMLDESKEYIAGLDVWEYMRNVYSNFVPAFGVYIGRMFKEFPTCLKGAFAKEEIAGFINNILAKRYMLLPVAIPVYARQEPFLINARTYIGTVEGTPTIVVELYLGFFTAHPPYRMVGIFTHELLHYAAPFGTVLDHSRMVDILVESDCLYLQALVTERERMEWPNKEEEERLNKAFQEAQRKAGDQIERIESEVDELFTRVTGLNADEAFRLSGIAALLEYGKKVQMELPYMWKPSMLSQLLYWAGKNGLAYEADFQRFLGLSSSDVNELINFARQVLRR